MADFSRHFPIERLSDPVLVKNEWFCDLLRRWRPAGDSIGRQMAGGEKEHLRVAIRAGYLNFYRAGQSIANVSFDRRGNLQAKIHNKYVYGIDGCGQKYVTASSARVSRVLFSGDGHSLAASYPNDGSTRANAYL